MTHHGEALARESGDASLPGAVASGQFDLLPTRSRLLCAYALKLTRDPSSIRVEDLVALRGNGLDDRGIVDTNQVVAYFNYVNRVAHGLGVDLEPNWPAEERGPRHYPLANAGESLTEGESGPPRSNTDRTPT